MSEGDIEQILATSRRNNERDGITGALLYHRGRFVQIVEGEDEILLSRVAVIAADPRHRDVHTMRRKQIWSRQFPEWTMGFRAAPGEPAALLDGFEDFFARSGRTRLQHADNEAQQFLEWLGEYWLQA
jgi:hypothetical protein